MCKTALYKLSSIKPKQKVLFIKWKQNYESVRTNYLGSLVNVTLASELKIIQLNVP